MPRKALTVRAGDCSYPVEIGAAALQDRQLWARWIGDRRVLAVSDEHVAPLYLTELEAVLPAKALAHAVVLPAGEQAKTPTHWLRIIEAASDAGLGRDAIFVALGGGVVGDLCGFAAASYMRGVDFIQCPTTLLAQIDAAVGGKTGFNYAMHKNLIGAFHQPIGVICDPLILKTLPTREYRAGLGEALKYALAFDADLFGYWQAEHSRMLAGDPDHLTTLITACLQWKAAIVAEDATERGRRALLNLGHTFAHALESVTDYQSYLHGEAVAVGLVCAAWLSERTGMAEDVCEPTREWLAAAGLPTQLESSLSARKLLTIMRGDKKQLGGLLRLILLRRIGAAEVVPAPGDELLLETWAARGAGS